MNIQLIGAGRIGSTIAYHLSRAGHRVSVVARGARLEALRRDGAIVTVDGLHAPVQVLPAADTSTDYDLAIVTVPEHQLDGLLPVLPALRAGKVLLMFNTFLGTAPYRALLGDERMVFGFPSMMASLSAQRLRFKVKGAGMVTTLSSRALLDLFAQAGLPAEVESDIDAFLRSHAALVVPLFLAALWMWQRPADLSWAEARRLDAAWDEAFELVRAQGHALKPRAVGMVAGMPKLLRTALLWAFSRSHSVKFTGAFGPDETRHLIDTMVAAAPGKTRHLLSLRP